MKTLFYSLLASLLLTSCGVVRPSAPLTSAPLNASQSLSLDSTDTREFELDLCGNLVPVPAAAVVVALPALPPNLSPRQQRRWLRTASKAQARVVRAQKPTTPLISTVKVKNKSDQRGSLGGTYAPRAHAPVAAGGSTAALTETHTPTWLWALLAALAAFCFWRARATR